MVLAFASWTGVGLLIGLSIAAAVWAVNRFKSNDIQKWLAKSKFGSLANKSDKFRSLLEQQTALAKLAGG